MEGAWLGDSFKLACCSTAFFDVLLLHFSVVCTQFCDLNAKVCVLKVKSQSMLVKMRSQRVLFVIIL